MEVEEWVKIQKSQWRAWSVERIDSGNAGMDVYLRELGERTEGERRKEGEIK